MPTLPSRRLGMLRLALAGLVFVLAPAAAEAFTTRQPQRTGLWRGHPTQQAKPMRMAKRAPFKAKAQTKAAPAAKPAEAAAPAKSPEHAGAWTAGEGGRACFRSRRKLWQAEEGWVVKKVNVCP